MNVDLDAIRLWIPVLNIVVTSILGVLLWVNARRQVTQDKIDSVQNRSTRGLEKIHIRVDGHEGRLHCIETELRMLPKSAEIQSLVGKIEGLNGRIDGLNRAVDLMNEFLINRGK